MHDTAVSP